MGAVEAIEDVDFIFVGFQWVDGFRQGDAGEGDAFFEAFWDGGERVKSLILEEKDNAFGGAGRGGAGGAGGEGGGDQAGTCGGGHLAEDFSSRCHHKVLDVRVGLVITRKCAFHEGEIKDDGGGFWGQTGGGFFFL